MKIVYREDEFNTEKVFQTNKTKLQEQRDSENKEKAIQGLKFDTFKEQLNAFEKKNLAKNGSIIHYAVKSDIGSSRQSLSNIKREIKKQERKSQLKEELEEKIKNHNAFKIVSNNQQLQHPSLRQVVNKTNVASRNNTRVQQ